LLRCAWALEKNEWITLPGPAEWWPDNEGYYEKHMFDIRVDQKDNYLKALKVLRSERPPQGWFEEMGPPSRRGQLIWNRFF